jgi:hypothetical protein
MRTMALAMGLGLLMLPAGCVVATVPADEPAAMVAVAPAASPSEDVHAELQRLERLKWIPSTPREEFLALFAEDFVSVEYGSNVHGGVHRRTRADVFSGPPAAASHYELSDWHFVRATADAVVVSYRVTGVSFPWQAYATSVWVRRDGRWQTVFYQTSTAEDPAVK